MEDASQPKEVRSYTNQSGVRPSHPSERAVPGAACPLPPVAAFPHPVLPACGAQPTDPPGRGYDSRPQDALLSGPLDWLRSEPRVGTAVSVDTISQSIAAIAGSPSAPFPILVVTGDHALLTPAMVDGFLGRLGDADAAVAVVERHVVESGYPETRRTWLRLRGGHYSGANLFALRTELARRALALWAGTERDRKKALRLMLAFGPVLALQALTRTISLDSALNKLGKRIGLRIRAVPMPQPEAAIDVDKPADLALAERILIARQK